jgi:hypothetical protein
MDSFNKGVAFIYEGDTEGVFYQSMLKHYLSKYTEYGITKELENPIGEYRYILTNGVQSIVMKTFTVGAVIAHPASANWFRNSCRQKYKGIDWVVFLCYDTESYNYDISQFQEGDWKELKKSLSSNRKTTVFDLAASADIEDIMLLDFNGVCDYLGILKCDIPKGRKGKTKMKNLFRDNGSTYHEGERAKLLIDFLDKDKIISKSSIPFHLIEKACFL